MEKTQSKKPLGSSDNPNCNEGEGSRSAARDYNRRTEAFIRSGKVERNAKKAEKAIESPEGNELLEAEWMGRSHAKK